MERFWAKVNKTDTCWLWTASAGRYGRFKLPSGRLGYAHVVSYELAHGPVPEGYMVDHIDCVSGLCVRPTHLRLATRKQNGENRTGPASHNKSGYRGVHWDSNNGKWRASVRHNGRAHHVGRFDTPEEANVAVVAKRNQLFSHNDQDR